MWKVFQGELREPCVALETSTYLPAGRGRMTSRGPDAAAERAKQIVVTMGFALPSESANRAFSGVGRRKMPSKFQSEERRVGKESGSTCRSRGSQYHEKKKKNNNTSHQRQQNQ